MFYFFNNNLLLFSFLVHLTGLGIGRWVHLESSQAKITKPMFGQPSSPFFKCAALFRSAIHVFFRSRALYL
jgi:hypothetical protein